MRPFAFLTLAAILAPATALAQQQTFTVNPDASQVILNLKTTHEPVNGTFHVQSGSIQFDRSTGAISGSVSVLAASGKTGNDTRDKKMTKDILKVKQYATISFEPKSYTGTLAPSGQSDIQVKGNFMLLGTPHEITVPMQVYFDGPKATAKTHFVLPYVKWGVKNPTFLMWKVENDLSIDLFLSGTLSN